MHSNFIAAVAGRSGTRWLGRAGLLALAAACSEQANVGGLDRTRSGAQPTMAMGGVLPAAEGAVETPPPAVDDMGQVGPPPEMLPEGMVPANVPLATTTPDGARPPTLGELAEQPAAMADWTIVIYGHGDHNLSASLSEDIREMQAARLNEGIQVVVLADFNSQRVQPESDPPVNFPDGVYLYRIPGNGAPLEVLATLPEANLDDPAVLQALVRDSFSARPSRHRGFIVWDHGGGWRGFGGDTQNGTVGAPTLISPEVGALALEAGLKEAGISASPPLDFLSFDACLMAGVETLYPFRNVSQIFISNAELDYGDGWDYEATLSYIAANPDALIEELAVAEVSHWDAHHVSASLNDTVLRSHVALDLSRMDFVASSAATLSGAFVDSLTFDANDLGRSAFFSLAPYGLLVNQPDRPTHLRDMGQLAGELAITQSDPAVVTAAQTLRRALDGMVLARAQGTARTSNGQVGVNVEQTLGGLVSPALLNAYGVNASQWIEASRWSQVLAFAARAADQEPPVFQQELVAVEANRAAPPQVLLQTADPKAAKAVVMAFAVQDDGGMRSLGAVGGGRLDLGVSNGFEWSGLALAFPDGQYGTTLIWMDTAVDSEPPLLGIPGTLSWPGTSDVARVMLLLQLAADGSGAVAQDFVLNAGGELLSVLSAEELTAAIPDTMFQPGYQVFDAAGTRSDVLGNPMPLPAAGFRLDAVALPAGRYALGTQLTSIWGSVASDLDIFTLTESLEP